jgi:hypothetical protein
MFFVNFITVSKRRSRIKRKDIEVLSKTIENMGYLIEGNHVLIPVFERTFCSVSLLEAKRNL